MRVEYVKGIDGITIRVLDDANVQLESEFVPFSSRCSSLESQIKLRTQALLDTAKMKAQKIDDILTRLTTEFNTKS